MMALVVNGKIESDPSYLGWLLNTSKTLNFSPKYPEQK